MFEIRPYNRNNMRARDPFRAMEELEREFFGMSPFSFFGERKLPEFRTDVKDNGDSYVLEADLPGFEKGDINIDVERDTLRISAERHSEHEEEDKKGKYIRCERSYGSYSREFDITGIDADGIKAKYDNGVLTIDLPKKKEEIPESRRLEIE